MLRIEFVIVSSLLVKLSASARILCIFPTPFYSHQSVFQPIWHELSIRGHDVTVITTNPIQNTSLPNLTQIDLSFTYKLVYDDHQMEYVINTESNVLILMKHVFFVMNNMTFEQMNHASVQNLLNDDNQKFDLLIVEAHVPAWYAFSKKYNCPIIGITSMAATNYLSRAMGNINNAILTPSANLPFTTRLSLPERIISVLFEVLDEIQTTYFLIPKQEEIARAALNDTDIDLLKISRSFSLLFTSTIPGFTSAAPSVPSIIQLNGLHFKPPGPLSQDVQEFLDGAKEGVIYFSLGSSVKSHLMTEEKQRIFVDVFRELHYRVVWKFESAIESLPENVKILKWAQQQDILRHKNVVLFISQGGIQSIEESVRFKVPILGIPFFGDQFRNVRRLEDLKIGAGLDFKMLSRKLLRESILGIVNKAGSYKCNLRKLSLLSEMASEKSLDKAIWWIEYVIKHNGAEILQSPLKHMPFFQYYLIDVIVFIFVVAFILTWISLKIFKYCIEWWRRFENKIKRD